MGRKILFIAFSLICSAPAWATTVQIATAPLSSEFRKREDFETNQLLQRQIQKVYASIRKQGFNPVRHELEVSASIMGRTDIFVQTNEGKVCRSFHDNFSDFNGEVLSVKCL